ncbi:DUF4034 domain-containing protein [Nevskia soli]|uniref:DUF4034 domain-containing protein n=1 Tax=Nevskia soli TaxID=418856 RepID=UPI0004A73725|nr:DUF4034 domain-containing protein [Nevskia soli]
MSSTPRSLLRLRTLLVLGGWLFCLSAQADLAGPPNADTQALTWLKSAQYRVLDAHYGALQHDYETGRAPEQALYQGYVDLYEEQEANSQYFDGWVIAFPKSYAARTARGAYYYRMAWASRGHDYASNTPLKQIDTMRRYVALAQTDLRASLTMTRKPYMSTLYLLNAAMMNNQKDELRHWLDLGNDIDPGNTLLRARYMTSLLPKWYGSYPRMRGFLEECRRQHLPPAQLARLEAMIETAMATEASRDGKMAAAYDHWSAALELSKITGEPLSAADLYAFTYAAWHEGHGKEADLGLAQLETIPVKEAWIMTQMGNMYVLEKRMKEAWAVLLKAAELDDASAQLAVGKTLYLGCVDIDQPADPEAGLVWIRRAAGQGLAEAKAILRYANLGHAAGWFYLRMTS